MKPRSILAVFLALLLMMTMFPAAIAEETEPALRLIASTELGFCMQNPWKGRDGLLSYLQFRALLQADGDLNPSGGDLAENYSVSDDGLTYTFTLKEGLKWSDGADLTVQDVVWSLKTMLYAYNVDTVYLNAIKKIVGAVEYAEGKADDISGLTTEGNVITIQLVTPYSDMLRCIAQIAILPEHVLGEIAPDQIYYALDYWQKPVSCGMFAVTEFVPDSYCVMTVNPYYEGTQPQIRRIIVRSEKEAILEAQSGNIDFFGTNDIETATVVKGLNDYTAHSANVTYLRYLMFNIAGADGHTNPAMMDVRVRQAVAYAVDWQTVVGGLYGDMASFTTTGVLASAPFYIGEMYHFDPDYAKQLLAEAGYDSSYNFRILYGYNDQTTLNLLEAISYYLGQVGINCTLVHTTNASQDLWITREFDMYYGALSEFSQIQWYEQYTKSTFNGIMDGNTYFADLCEKIATAVSNEEYENYMKEAQKIEAELRYRIPVYTLAYQYYTSSKVNIPEDMQWGNPWYNNDYRFAEWTLN